MKLSTKRDFMQQEAQSSGAEDRDLTIRGDDGEVLLSVRFAKAAYDMLQQLARETGKSEVEILRDALALQRAYQDTRARGGHIFTEREGKYSELVLA